MLGGRGAGNSVADHHEPLWFRRHGVVLPLPVPSLAHKDVAEPVGSTTAHDSEERRLDAKK
jgi:hypothetical protein